MTLVERAAEALVGLLGEPRDGLSFNDRSFGLRTHDLGLVHLPSGRLVACDPLIGDGGAFTRSVPVGSHHVRALVAEYADNGDQRLAAAVVELGTAPVVEWTQALLPDGDAPRHDDDYVGYPVDAGTGCFASPEAAQRLAERADELQAALDNSYVLTWEWANLDVGDGLNVVAFSSGWGDGIFPTTFGLAADGTPVVAVTDFFVFDATAV